MDNPTYKKLQNLSPNPLFYKPFLQYHILFENVFHDVFYQSLYLAME